MGGSENKSIKPRSKVDRSAMTMASKCRCVLLFLAPVFLVSVSLAVDLKEACSTTPYPELCVAVLSANPESKAAADARGLALIAIRTAGKMADDASSAVDVELRANPGVIDALVDKPPFVPVLEGL
jgi:pectinesterase inhibitor-like protein